MFVNTLFKDVYAGNGEFGREKQRVVNESTIDIERYTKHLNLFYSFCILLFILFGFNIYYRIY